MAVLMSVSSILLCVLCGEKIHNHRGHRGTQRQKQKPPHQRTERSRMAVSPCDGINRIRFKGSPSRTLSPDQKSGLPRNDIWFSSGRLILELEHAFRNCLDETDCELSQRKPGP